MTWESSMVEGTVYSSPSAIWRIVLRSTLPEGLGQSVDDDDVLEVCHRTDGAAHLGDQLAAQLLLTDVAAFRTTNPACC